jgi:hypothetical protein
MVVGEFEVRGVINDRVDRLWSRTRTAAGIDRAPLFAYFAGREFGYAIEVGRVRRYRQPLRLDSTERGVIAGRSNAGFAEARRISQALVTAHTTHTSRRSPAGVMLRASQGRPRYAGRPTISYAA